VGFTSTGKLPNFVCICSAAVDWNLTAGTDVYDLGPSGPHKIYVTYGTPAGSCVTQQRVEAVCQYASGKSGLKECADAVFDHLPQLHAHKGAPEDGPIPIWMLYEANPNDVKTESQCPGLALFVQKHFEMLGLGSGQIVYCYADKDGTYKSSATPIIIQERQIDATSPPHPQNTTHDDYSGVGRLYMIDSHGTPNNFEAALLFHGYYYVLGYGRDFTTPREIVRAVFGRVDWRYKIGNSEDGGDISDWAGVCDVEPWMEGVPTG
jgi:hypothetical protein